MEEEQQAKPQDAAKKNHQKTKLQGERQPGQSKQQTSSKLRGRPQDTPEVRISKTLSWVLRHGAQQEGLPIRSDGYVCVQDLVRILDLSLKDQYVNVFLWRK